MPPSTAADATYAKAAGFVFSSCSLPPRSLHMEPGCLFGWLRLLEEKVLLLLLLMCVRAVHLQQGPRGEMERLRLYTNV